MGVRDSRDLAWQDWLGTAGFDRPEDAWPRRWAEAYVDFAAGEKRSWLRQQGLQIFPVVGWAERGGYLADGHGNSVPRFHVTWGTGPGVVEPFARRVQAAVDAGLVQLRFRHRVDGLDVTDGTVTGVHGSVLEPSSAARGEASSRTSTGDFALTAQAVIVTSGGIGGNPDLVRSSWPARLGTPPADLLSGVPGPCRWTDAGHHRARRRPRDQPRPDVALHRRHRQLGAGLGATRHPDPARTVARCGWTRQASGCPLRCSPGSTPSAP